MAFVLFCGVYAVAQSQPLTQTRETQLINDDWQFTLGDDPLYRTPTFNDSKWRTLNVPHDWSIESPYTPDFPAGKNNGYFSEGIGWYRKHFDLSKEQKNRNFVIQFDGVFMNAEVWINGHYCGRRPYGYATFRYNITRFLNFEKENIVAVRVDNSNPGADRWYHGSGIYRDVYLISTGFTHFRFDHGVQITTPKAEASEAVVKMDYSILASYFTDQEIITYGKNKWGREDNGDWEVAPFAHTCLLRTTIYDAKGKEVAQQTDTQSIKNYINDYLATQELTVKTPHRWSAEDPYLYTIKSELVYEGKTLDDVVTPYGIRKLEYIPNKGMFVNDKEVLLKGVCLHHACGSMGAAVTDKMLEFRFNKLKAIGCNAIRTSHNPYSPAFYRMCDKMGFYVKDECFDEWRSGWNFNYTENAMGKAMNGYNLLFDQWADTDLKDMICRDRNHPSVVMYSIGNEIPDWRHNPDAPKIAHHLVDLCHTYDPTRPVAIGNNCCLSTDRNGIKDAFDLLGYNYINRDHGEAMYEPEHKMRPRKLCFGSETRKEIWYYTAMRDKPYVIGQFIWTGFDYLGETHEKSRRGSNGGVMDMTGHLRAEGARVACCWRTTPTIDLRTSLESAGAERPAKLFTQAGNLTFENQKQYPSWNWKQGDKPYVIVNCGNLDEVELILNGKSLGRKTNDKMKCYVEWQVPFETGTIEAIAYQDGKEKCRTALKTALAAYRIAAKPVWKTLKTDGNDINILEVSIVDKNGIVVPRAKKRVHVQVKGSAKCLGIDTENLFYDGLFQTDNRETSLGRMLVTIKALKGNKAVTVTLTSKGLKPVTIKM